MDSRIILQLLLIVIVTNIDNTIGTIDSTIDSILNSYGVSVKINNNRTTGSSK